MEEHEEIVPKLSVKIDEKVNKKEHRNLTKIVEKLEENFQHLLDQVNNIKIPSPVKVPDDSNKYNALERMLVAMEEKLDRVKEELNKKMNGVNKIMEMIKEDVDKNLEEQELQVMKAMSKGNVCEMRIDALEKQSNNNNVKGSLNTMEVEFKEAMEAIKNLEKIINDMKEGNFIL